MSLIRPSLIVILGVSATAGALAACRSAVNLDVAYRDGGAPSDGAADGQPGIPPGVELEGCPCDESAGFGCCVTSNGPSFCTTDLTQCQFEHGVFMKCFHPDRNSESQCCWHGTIGEVGSQAAYAVGCDAGPPSCTTNDDCRGHTVGNDTCNTILCNDQTIGACGAANGAKPACPK